MNELFSWRNVITVIKETGQIAGLSALVGEKIKKKYV